MMGARKGDGRVAGAAPDSVRVISTTNVAGFDATTVQADDPHALARWLGDHGFVSTEQLEQWLARRLPLRRVEQRPLSVAAVDRARWH